MKKSLFMFLMIVLTMPIRLTQVGALGYDREHVRLLLDTVEVSASLP